MSPTTMSWWMRWFLSCKSKSVLAKPLEHQCSVATISPGLGSNSGRISPPHVPYSKRLRGSYPGAIPVLSASGGVTVEDKVASFDDRVAGKAGVVHPLVGGFTVVELSEPPAVGRGVFF